MCLMKSLKVGQVSKKTLTLPNQTVIFIGKNIFACLFSRVVATRMGGWGVGGAGAGRGSCLPPPLQFLNQRRSKSFSFKYQGYCFLRVFRNYSDQKFQNFYRVCYNFWTIYSSFSFFNYTGKIDHFRLDLLQRSDT